MRKLRTIFKHYLPSVHKWHTSGKRCQETFMITAKQHSMLFVADWLVIILLLYLRTKIRIYVGCIGKVILLLLPNTLSFLFTLFRVLYNLSKTIIYVCLFLPINYRQINVTNLINERDKSYILLLIENVIAFYYYTYYSWLYHTYHTSSTKSVL